MNFESKFAHHKKRKKTKKTKKMGNKCFYKNNKKKLKGVS